MTAPEAIGPARRLPPRTVVVAHEVAPDGAEAWRYERENSDGTVSQSQAVGRSGGSWEWSGDFDLVVKLTASPDRDPTAPNDRQRLAWVRCAGCDARIGEVALAREPVTAPGRDGEAIVVPVGALFLVTASGQWRRLDAPHGLWCGTCGARRDVTHQAAEAAAAQAVRRGRPSTVDAR